MSDANRLFFLRIALIAIGLTFIFGIYALGIVWPSGWVWGPGHPQHYLMMIIGVYATLGVFLILASRDPFAYKSIIWFTVWSSIVYGGPRRALLKARPCFCTEGKRSSGRYSIT